MSFCLKLVLGLPIPALVLSSPTPACACGQQYDFFGYNWLFCQQNAGHAHWSAQDVVQLGLKKELQCFGRLVVYNDAEQRSG